MNIKLAIQQQTTCIALHSYKLVLSEISLLTINGSTLLPNQVRHLAAAQITILDFADVIEVQAGAQLTIAFSGNFNNQSANGFFLSDNEFDPSSLERERKEEAFAVWRDKKNKKVNNDNNKKKELNLVAGQRKMYATQVLYNLLNLDLFLILFYVKLISIV